MPRNCPMVLRKVKRRPYAREARPLLVTVLADAGGISLKCLRFCFWIGLGRYGSKSFWRRVFSLACEIDDERSDLERHFLPVSHRPSRLALEPPQPLGP